MSEWIGEDGLRSLRASWEKHPCVLCTGVDAAHELFSLELAKRVAPLQAQTDLCAVRTSHGNRVDALASEHTVPAARIDQLWRNGFTLQCHHPQRFEHCTRLYRLLASFEAATSSLCGSNAYITPPNCQGLPLHFDNIEALVFQVSGRKRWLVYEPVHGFPRHSQRDLGGSSCMSGRKLLIDRELSPGDILYMPRGTPHEAVASQSQSSVHVTISLYERNAIGDFALELVKSALEQPLESSNASFARSSSLRKGLPWSADEQTACRAVLNAFGDADVLASLPSSSKRAMRNFAMDFVCSRLPPPPEEVCEQGPCPAQGDRVRNVVADRKSWTVDEESGTVVHCIRNKRRFHMVSSPHGKWTATDAGDAVVSQEGGQDEDNEEEEEDEMQQTVQLEENTMKDAERMLSALSEDDAVAIHELSSEAHQAAIRLWCAGMVSTVPPNGSRKRKRRGEAG